MSVCNVKSLTVQAVRCLFAGVTEEAAMRKIIRVALEEMDIDVFGIFVQNLPPQQQQILRDKFEKEFGSLPLPWEEGYDSGSMDNTNAYIKYYKTAPLEAKVAKRKAERSVERITAGLEELEQEREKAKNDVEMINDFFSDINSLDWDADAEQLQEETEWLDEFLEEEATLPSPPETPEPEDPAQKEAEALEAEVKAKSEEEIAEEQVEPEPEPEQSELSKLWSEMTPEERQAAIEAGKAPEHEGGTYGTALGNMQKLIIDAYIKNMMDTLQIDQLLSVLERFPGSELLPRLLNQAECSFQGMFEPPVNSFLKTFSLDVCGDTGIGLGTPKLVARELPNFYDKSFLTKLRNEFINKVETAWTGVLTKILLKVLQTIDDAICKGLNAAAGWASNSMGLQDAIADTFCPNASPEDINNTNKKLFKAAGIKPNTPAVGTKFSSSF